MPQPQHILLLMLLNMTYAYLKTNHLPPEHWIILHMGLISDVEDLCWLLVANWCQSMQ
jgi:hypothetical protein